MRLSRTPVVFVGIGLRLIEQAPHEIGHHQGADQSDNFDLVHRFLRGKTGFGPAQNATQE